MTDRRRASRPGERRLPHDTPELLSAGPRLARLGLLAILVAQAAMSAKLIWSNGAFADEALYLNDGRFEWAHWLHGAPLPPMHTSGAPQIYPPLGALASSIGGLAGARLLSLAFMLIGTALLYCAGARLFGRGAALAGAALWAISEPVLRLAFATYDPLACMLIITGAWLAIRSADCRRLRNALLLASASAAVLGLATLTAESFAIMVPVVGAISLFTWADRMGYKRAFLLTAGQVLTAAVLAVAALFMLGLWHDAVGSTVHRKVGLGQGVSMVAGSAYRWEGTVFIIALIPVIISFVTRRPRTQSLLLLTCALAGALVPIYQAHLGTRYALDKHMSAGDAFTALAAGYAIQKVRLWFLLSARVTAGVVAVVCVVPALQGLGYAQNTFRLWADLRPVMADARQLNSSAALEEVANNQLNILRYYLPNANWKSNAAATARSRVLKGQYTEIVYDFSEPSKQTTPVEHAASLSNQAFRTEILSIAKPNSLIAKIEDSYRYALVGSFPYSFIGPGGNGIYLVWKVVPLPPNMPPPGRKKAGKHHHHRGSGTKHAGSGIANHG